MLEWTHNPVRLWSLSMLDQLIRQLDDADPARRKQAVIALGKSRDRSALPPLANTYHNDHTRDHSNSSYFTSIEYRN